MGFVIFMIIWYNLWGKNNPRIYRKLQVRKNKNIVKWIVIGLIVFSFFGEDLLAAGIGLAVAAAPFLIIWKLIQSSAEKNKRRSSVDYQAIYRSEQRDFSLPKDVKKRAKIVTKFNEKYDLNLNEEQIMRIVEASYVNYYWEKEIFDMTKDYSIPLEWYQGETSWLRSYLKAFPSMNIVSDFAGQFEVVEREFRRILDETDMTRYYSVDDCIEDINRRYNLWFDEQTFTMMLRYMADRGYPVRMPSPADFHYESEMDRLAQKYDEDGAAAPTRGRGASEEAYPGETEMERLARRYDETDGTSEEAASERRAARSNGSSEKSSTGYYNNYNPLDFK